MALTPSKVKTPLGMQTLDFWPITAEPENAHPTYDSSVNLGAAVKGYLTVFWWRYDSLSIFGLPRRTSNRGPTLSRQKHCMIQTIAIPLFFKRIAIS